GQDVQITNFRGVGCGIRPKPPASSEPRLPHHRHPDDRCLGAALRRVILCTASVANTDCTLRRRLDISVRRPLLRTEAARVFQRSTLPLRRAALVARQDSGQSVATDAAQSHPYQQFCFQLLFRRGLTPHFAASYFRNLGGGTKKLREPLSDLAG